MNTGLHSNVRGCNTDIPYKQYDIDSTQLCRLQEHAKRKELMGGNIFSSNNGDIPTPNESILNISQIIKAGISAAAEAVLSTVSVNTKEAVRIKIILEEMGYSRPTTLIQTDNSTANGVVNNTIAKTNEGNGDEISLVKS